MNSMNPFSRLLSPVDVIFKIIIGYVKLPPFPWLTGLQGFSRCTELGQVHCSVTQNPSGSLAFLSTLKGRMLNSPLHQGDTSANGGEALSL